MPNHQARFQSMVFNNETTNRTDFQNGDIKDIITTKYKDIKGSCMRIRPAPLKDINALTDWRVPNVPFDLFRKKKDNPYEVQKPYGKVEDFGRKNAQMTRPRLIITPALSLDDMEEGPRKIIVENMYKTSNEQSVPEVHTNIKAPLTKRPAPANPISISKLSFPYVSPEWRMDSVSWDNRQLRTHCDSTKEFWLARTPNCTECKNTAHREAMKKMKPKL